MTLPPAMHLGMSWWTGPLVYHYTVTCHYSAGMSRHSMIVPAAPRLCAIRHACVYMQGRTHHMHLRVQLCCVYNYKP